MRNKYYIVQDYAGNPVSEFKYKWLAKRYRKKHGYLYIQRKDWLKPDAKFSRNIKHPRSKT